MNELIKKLLQECEHCTIPTYSDDTTILHIPKHEIKKPLTFKLNSYYRICIDDYILNPPEGFTLAKNWNSNTNPPCKYMNVVVNQLMGQMVKIEGIGFDMEQAKPINISWSGWLPVSNVKIMEEI